MSVEPWVTLRVFEAELPAGSVTSISIWLLPETSGSEISRRPSRPARAVMAGLLPGLRTMPVDPACVDPLIVALGVSTDDPSFGELIEILGGVRSRNQVTLGECS